MSTPASTIKARHYAALSSRIRQLRVNLADTEVQLDAMSAQLKAMAQLGIACGAQFMAVSRLLDDELSKTTQEQDSTTAT